MGANTPAVLSAKATGVWMGLRPCGCPVAVTTDYTGTEAEKETRADTNRTKREFLSSGLSVVYATWEQWTTVYVPKFKRECEHVLAQRQSTVADDSSEPDAVA